MYSLCVHFWKKTKLTRCHIWGKILTVIIEAYITKLLAYLFIRRFTLPFVAQFPLTLRKKALYTCNVSAYSDTPTPKNAKCKRFQCNENHFIYEKKSTSQKM
jgi:urea transporter